MFHVIDTVFKKTGMGHKFPRCSKHVVVYAGTNILISYLSQLLSNLNFFIFMILYIFFFYIKILVILLFLSFFSLVFSIYLKKDIKGILHFQVIKFHQTK